MNPTLINQKGFKSFSIKLLLSFLIFSSPLKAKDSIKWTSLVETCKEKGSEICAGNFIASASCGFTLSYVNGNSLEEANTKAHKLFTAFMNFAQIDESIISASPKIIAEADKDNTVAILFGREDRGLTNEELQRCNLHVHIPANEDYPVLNVAMSVQVVCYQLLINRTIDSEIKNNQHWDVPLAEANHVNRLIEHFTDVAEKLEVFNKGNPRQIGARIKRLFTRVGLDEMEVNFMRGFLAAVEKKLEDK